MGLTIAKEIVEAHGGKIWAESEPGQGAKFIITFALTPALAKLTLQNCPKALKMHSGWRGWRAENGSPG